MINKTQFDNIEHMLKVRPIADASDDELCRIIEKPKGNIYDGTTREALEFEEFNTYMDDPQYDLGGTILHSDGNYTVIFWKLRSDV